jgi:hypothetical protein
VDPNRSLARAAPPARDSWQSALEEAEELRDAGPEEHYRLLRAACDLAFAILAVRPDRQEVLDYEEPLPPESVALLERMIRTER